jgi:hypothetical protein
MDTTDPSNVQPNNLQDLPVNLTNQCAKCKKPAAHQCAKCLRNFYCSKECQTSHWQYHKHGCKTPAQTLVFDAQLRSKFYNYLLQLISGNVYIIAAHYGITYGDTEENKAIPSLIDPQLLYGVVHIQLSEKFGDLIKGGPNHFAHLNWIHARDLSPSDYASAVELFKAGSTSDNPSHVVQVMINLSDHKEHMNIALNEQNLTLAKIKASHKDPGRDLTILLDLK